MTSRKGVISVTILSILQFSVTEMIDSHNAFRNSTENCVQCMRTCRPQVAKSIFSSTCLDRSQKKQREKTCENMAKRVGVEELKDENQADLEFFKKCIVDYYCFVKGEKQDAWIKQPTFRRKLKTRHFTTVAKRAELFFVRNNDWQRTMTNPAFRNVGNGSCTRLLYVIAARYLYVVYTLDRLSEYDSFDACRKHRRKNIIPGHGVCYLPPTGTMKCTSELEVMLLGLRSGSLTALFNQYFREPLGRDPEVAGFRKSSEEIFGANIIAFKLDFAIPRIMAIPYGHHYFIDGVNEVEIHLRYQMLEVVIAMYKMRKFSTEYFNDLMSDQIELRSQPLLAKIFHLWTMKLKVFDEKVTHFIGSSHFSHELSFRRRHNIAYELILGTIEGAGTSPLVLKLLSEDAIALLYDAEVYLTRGAIRHVIGEMEMGHFIGRHKLDAYWLSMLENWADANKEYNRECVKHNLKIQICLLKMCKYLRRMVEAMYKARQILQKRRLSKHLLNMDRYHARKILTYWVELKDNGISKIPKMVIRNHIVYNSKRSPQQPHQTSVTRFLLTFGCTTSRYLKRLGLSSKCMDVIHNEVRKYNRKLFMAKVRAVNKKLP